MRAVTRLLIAVLGIVAVVACSPSADERLTSLNEALRDGPALDDASRGQLQQIVDDAARLLREGHDEAADALLADGEALVKHAKDAAMMNRSDG